MHSYLQTLQRAQQLVIQSLTIPSAHFRRTDETFSMTPEQGELRGTEPGIFLDKTQRDNSHKRLSRLISKTQQN